MGRVVVLLTLLATTGGGLLCAMEIKPSQVFRGTINVLAANDQGMAAVTDSMLTDQNGVQMKYDGQKLFQIDAYTVCTVAGFSSAQTPAVKEFLNQASGMMLRFKGELMAQRTPVPVAEKIRMLESIFSYYIAGVADIRGPVSKARDYGFQLLIAGYDPDGTPEVGYLALEFDRREGRNGLSIFTPTLDRSFVVPVGHDLTLLFAGKWDVAEQMLSDSAAWKAADRSVAGYAQNCIPIDSLSLAWRCRAPANIEVPLTVPQMRGLGLLVKEYTSSKDPTVGGSSQIALLQQGRVQNLEQPTFPPPQEKKFNFKMMVGSTCRLPRNSSLGRCVVIEDPSPHLTLFIGFSFENVMQNLDDGYFSGNSFERSMLRYEGGSLRFEPSNKIIASSLLIGWQVQDSCEAEHLVNDFDWESVVFEAGTPKTKKPCHWLSAVDRH